MSDTISETTKQRRDPSELPLAPRRRLAFALTVLFVPSASSAVAGEPDRVTFTEHVAPIIFNNCTSCHRPGEGTPFSLMNYRDVKKRSQLIRDVVNSGYMPPWPPAKGWGHFQDERRLTDEQISAIDGWVAGGLIEGPADKLPPQPEFSQGGWALGKPDLVVTLPEAFDVPADGKDIYRMFVLPLGLAEDKWVTAVEIRPTARSVVHHALYFLDSTGAARKLDAADAGPGFGRMGFPRTGTLGGWAVGATPRRLPMGLAYALPKGSDLVVQMHFHPSGKAEREQTSFGLYFAPEPPKKKLLGTQAPMAFGLGTELRTRGIKPGEKDFTIRGEWKVPFDIDLVSIGGHAHYLCTKMKAIAELPNGDEMKLFAIDDWDFNWQGRYNYAEPVRLPKGAIVRTELVYDNSKDNPRNPSNPPIHVRWGEGSTDEMGAVGLGFVAVNEQDIASYHGPAIFGGGDAVGRLGGGALGGGGNRLANLGPEQIAAIFDARDDDKDGKLKGDEVPERLRPFMGLLDANGDGALDLEEVQSLRAGAPPGAGRLMPQRGRGPRESRPPADGPPMSDLDGRTWHPLHPEEGTKAQVLFFVTHDCPIANQYSREIGRIARDFADKHVTFLLVHVDPDLSIPEAKEHAKEYEIKLPILFDRDHALVSRVGAAVTPEAAVIASDGTVLYVGRIDDRFGKLGRQRPEPSQHDLRDAIDAVLAGRPVAAKRVEAIGCPIADLKR
ncbi:MAG: redoxin family protein [Isosphaeraceae bacterium]|nr:redoxin family protein [Isosphaeraceae bacterium]